MPQLSRRRMLGASAVLLSGGAAGALATNRMTTVAAADTELSVTGDDATIRHGTLEAVWLDLAVGWAYSVPSAESPDTLTIDVRAGTDGDEVAVASAESGQLFLDAEGEESFSVDLLEAGALDAESVVPSEGGETLETTVTVAAEMRLFDADGFVIAADGQTAETTITIEKSDYDADEFGAIAGDGAITVDIG